MQAEADSSMMDTRAPLLSRAIHLEQATIAWNVIEAVVAVGAGIAAGSIALVGFGLDSIIEVIAASALYVRLRAEAQGREENEAAERRALRVVAVTFFVLAAYVAFEAATALLQREAPEASPVGIGLSVFSLAVMPGLAFAKLRAGRALGSAALVADSKETFACAWLSFTLLLGLGANALFGWWWADPVAALAMIPFLVREGREAWEEAEGEEGDGDEGDG